MAIEKISRNKNVTLGAAYTGTWYECSGSKRVQVVSSTGATVAYTVKFRARDGNDVAVEVVPAGSSPWTLDLAPGHPWQIDILAASGAPTAYITVV